MGETTPQGMGSLEDTDASFHTGMPMTTFHEPGFVFVFQTLLGTVTAFWQDHTLDAQVLCKLFVQFGRQAAIGTGLLGWLVEGLHMGLQTGFPLLLIAGVAIQNTIVTDQTAFDLVQPQLVSVLDGTRLLTAPDDVGMLLTD